MSPRQFQSAPAIAGGRCPSGPCRAPARAGCFNPRPPLLAGDACGHGPQTGAVLFQSAPAIAGGRCTQRALVAAVTRRCFNPRPPLLAGDARHDDAGLVLVVVSIRARHCWRAMHAHFARGAGDAGVSIRARHCWRAMRAWRFAAASRRPSFNPRPPLLAGDAASRAPAAPAACCFNPRPPLLAGDAGPSVGVQRRPGAFQSAPAIAGGRC